MYRIVRLNGKYIVEKPFLWLFWVEISNPENTLEQAESTVKFCQESDELGKKVVVRIYGD